MIPIGPLGIRVDHPVLERRLEIPRGDPKSCQEDVLKEDVFKAELKDLPEVNVCGTGVETDQKKRRSKFLGMKVSTREM